MSESRRADGTGGSGAKRIRTTTHPNMPEPGNFNMGTWAPNGKLGDGGEA